MNIALLLTLTFLTYWCQAPELALASPKKDPAFKTRPTSPSSEMNLSQPSRSADMNSHPPQTLAQNQPLIRFEYGKNELTQLCSQALSKTQKKLDALAQIPEAQRTPQNTLLAFEQILAEFSDETEPLTFMAYVSTDASLSAEASQCEEKVRTFFISVMTRKDLYRAIGSHIPQEPQLKRLYEETIQSFEESGLKLPDDQLEQVRVLQQNLASLETQFSTHLNQEKSQVEFSLSELQGVSESYLAGLPKTADGKVCVPTKEPDYVRVMENASRPATRKKMLEAYENRATPHNVQLLEQAIEHRQKIAALLGFSTWADYRTSTRMAKSSAEVRRFLTDLKGQLVSRNQEDLKLLLKSKLETQAGGSSTPAASTSVSVGIDPWDIRYFSNQVKKSHFQLDDEKIREYFPADSVVQAMFEVFSQVLGLEFTLETQAKTWAPNVHLFRIQDSGTQRFIGYFYTDFYPRSGKYGHAAAFTLKSGRKSPSGYEFPISAIVSNFTPPEAGKPSLLKHEEVRTLFHEFGHIMHQTLTQAPYASLSGSKVDRDFVESPSQMFENWVYSAEILKKISGHYLDPSKKLPDLWIEKIIEARQFNQGYSYTRQLFLALLDLTYHTSSGPVDTTETLKKIFQDTLGIKPSERTHFQASFGHLMGGYDAGYYGYLWSEVYASDLFSRFEAQGLLNPEVGLEYRRKVLEVGKMKDGFQILEDFLGRKPNAQAFLKRLHLGN
ncbi:MAG: M3 family metallopeptidase [Bdellovibrionia bacterium]